jgi:osmotically-inducible protein OsmY
MNGRTRVKLGGVAAAAAAIAAVAPTSASAAEPVSPDTRSTRIVDADTPGVQAAAASTKDIIEEVSLVTGSSALVIGGAAGLVNGSRRRREHRQLGQQVVEELTAQTKALTAQTDALAANTAAIRDLAVAVTTAGDLIAGTTKLRLRQAEAEQREQKELAKRVDCWKEIDKVQYQIEVLAQSGREPTKIRLTVKNGTDEKLDYFRVGAVDARYVKVAGRNGRERIARFRAGEGFEDVNEQISGAFCVTDLKSGDERSTEWRYAGLWADHVNGPPVVQMSDRVLDGTIFAALVEYQSLHESVQISGVGGNRIAIYNGFNAGRHVAPSIADDSPEPVGREL